MNNRFSTIAVLGICLCANLVAQDISETAVCNDSAYLALRKKNINSLTQREYEYFMLKETECIKNKAANQTGEKGEARSIEECEASKSAGRRFAEENKAAVGLGWGAIGIGAGFATGLIGGSVIITIASVSHPSPDTVPAKYGQECYTKGYKSVVKRKRVLGAIIGTIIGTTAVVLVLANNSH